MIDIQLIGLFNATLQAATLLFIAALGELITEKSGILNLGVEGMISVGAVTGFMTAVNTENIFLAVLVGVLSSSAFASIHALVTVVLKQDQTVSGLILTSGFEVFHHVIHNFCAFVYISFTSISYSICCKYEFIL